jgi:hypothetical protein
MRIVLFCENKYAIDILKPLQDEAEDEGVNDILWYVHQKRIPDFPLKDSVNWTNSHFQRGLLIEDNIKSQAIEKAIKYNCSRIGWKDYIFLLLHFRRYAFLKR